MLTAFTICARNYLSLAITLGKSLKEHQPDANFLIVVADGVEDLDLSLVPFDIRPSSDYLGDEIVDLAFKYDVTEFCTAIKPFVMRQLMADGEAELVAYLDPDMIVCSQLDSLEQALGQSSILITPHVLQTQIIEKRAYPEHKHLWEGIFNLGFCAVRPSKAGFLFVDWWIERLRKYCFSDYFDGLHTDQKWIDYAPVFFGDEVAICRHWGINVAHWNLDERLLCRSETGELVVNGDPLVIFHFSGFDFKGTSLSKHVSPADQQRYLNSTINELAAAYRSRVRDNGFDQFIAIPYGFSRFTDGTPITTLHRRIYRILSQERAIPNPFSSGGAFYAGLQKARLLSRGDRAAGNYAGRTLKGVDRASQIAETILRIVAKLLGPSVYSYMIKFFGRYTRPEAHAFLVRQHI